MKLWLVWLVVVWQVIALSAAQVVTYESITVTDTAVAISTATIAPAGPGYIDACEGRLETAQIRYRWDGTAPTAAEGTLLEVGDVLPIETYDDALRIRFIRTGSTSGVLKIHCWRNQ